jgi:AcrR family transcriptional regulator
MARTSDPARKPALLARVVDYLLDKPLATLSFRAIAAGLEISTYTLVYHFGSRDRLLHEIIAAVAERQNVVMPTMAAEGGDLDRHLANVRRSWQLGLEPRNLQLLRLEFEAAMLESREVGEDPITGRVSARWHRAGVDALLLMGLSPSDAELESRVMVGTIYGLQYDLIVSRDVARVSDAFDRAVEAYGQRVRTLLPAQTAGLPADGTMGAWQAR